MGSFRTAKAFMSGADSFKGRPEQVFRAACRDLARGLHVLCSEPPLAKPCKEQHSVSPELLLARPV